ncbi:hypothetical protein ACH429_25005 [Streptomyces pathocidini]|uniref:Uncharacterized protein n=1 Tax=Streptomyces pathocidini TaxID=1650571 RepID=A0ABW7UXW5_9ACTN|nr:hypothetical protein [Streptomyces pathocidini]
MKALDAAQRLDELLDDTTTAIRPKLKWRDGSTEVLQRNDAALNEPNGEATVSKTRYVRTKVSPAKLDRLLKSVADRWKESGYEVKDTAPKQPGFAGRAPDGFSVRCAVGGSGNIYFDAASSAVEDPGYSGTVPGEKGDRIPKDPDGYPLLKPDVTDPYWSA